MLDIEWVEGMTEGLARAGDLNRPVVVMPVGQGMDNFDTWCPAASHTRANLSHPDVVRLIREAFVPVRFSMHISGPGVDDVGRKFVIDQPASGAFDIFPADVFVVSPSGEVLARAPFDATPREILDTLGRVLLERSGEIPVPADEPTSPAEVALRALEARYDEETPQRTWWRDHISLLFRVDGDLRPEATPLEPSRTKAALVPELEAWLDAHAEAHPDLAPLARIMLGGARAHAGDLEGARRAWESVMALHATSGLRHRAAYNLIEPRAFPCLPLPDVVGVRRPTAVEAGVVVPSPERRAQNIRTVGEDRRYVHLSEGLPFVRIPAGTFTMGGSPAVQARELPQRRVTISKPFMMSAWPITRAVVRSVRPDAYPGIEHEGLAAWLPAVNLSHIDVLEICDALSRRDGRRYRLPTEAEWEYAARGGLEGKQYPWGDEPPDDRCNYVHKHPVPVACYAPNDYGLFDVVGNSFEWCADHYTKDAYAMTSREVTDPSGPTREIAIAQSPTSEAAHVARGGGWIGSEMCLINCRNSWRIGWPAGFRWCNLGARLVVDVDD